MDLGKSTSNPDPHGVQRLLTLLRSQQDAAAAAAKNVPDPNPFVPSSTADQASRRVYNVEPRYGAEPQRDTAAYDPYSFNPFTPAVLTPPSVVEKEHVPVERANMTFTQALPLLSTLAADPAFLAQLSAMKEEQHALERQLAAQHQSHVTLAMASAPLQSRTQQDRGLRESMLRQWDDLRLRQLKQLAKMDVPTFGSTAPDATKHQAKVFSVLVSMLDDDT